MISVITPTWQRHSDLLDHCIPSVQAQVGVELEHLVISDGPDPELRGSLIPDYVRYFELSEHAAERHWGAPARNFGITQARGEFIAYLDDDDQWEPEHLVSLLTALDRYPEAGFARSCAMIPVENGIPWRIGDGAIAHGRVQTSMLMHRSSLEAPWATDAAEDWNLVKHWVDKGIPCAITGQATTIYNPSGGTEAGFAVHV